MYYKRQPTVQEEAADRSVKLARDAAYKWNKEMDDKEMHDYNVKKGLIKP